MPGVRLGVEEREAIALGVAREESFAQIGRRMCRPTSTIAREVGRAGGRAE
jgi:IS30 family transposase